MVRIDVIIPVYNVGKWLRQCLDSVVNQSVPFYEIIIVNDGSTDRSSDIAKEYADEYDNIILICQRNAGLGAARNKGLSVVEGEYVLFLDADDYLIHESVEILDKYLSSQPIDAIYFNGSAFLDSAANERCFQGDCIRSDLLPKSIVSGVELFQESYPYNYYPSACLNLFRVDTLRRLNLSFKEGVFFEDNSFSFKYIDRVEKVLCIPEILYKRRYREGSITTSPMSLKKLRDLSKEYTEICSYMLDNINADKVPVWFRVLQDQMVSVLDYISRNEYESKTKSDADIMRFFENYIQLRRKMTSYDLIKDGLFINEYKILKGLKNCLDEDYKLYLTDDIESEHFISGVCSFYQQLYSGFCLNDSSLSIGVYGAGKHTEGLLRLYALFNSKQISNVIIILTNSTTDDYMGYPVVSVDDVKKKSFDRIIISSCKFHREMRNKLKENGITEGVIDIYDEIAGDVFSDHSIIDDLFRKQNVEEK